MRIPGKTTLLNVLSGKANAGVVGGAVLCNGVPFRGMKIENSISSDSRPSFAYVMQVGMGIGLVTYGYRYSYIVIVYIVV
jgi:hypothetical protein